MNRGLYYTDLRVDPANADRVYAVSSSLQVSIDGGKTFESVTGWVYRTAGNAVTDYYRRRGAFARATEALAAEPAAVLETKDSAAEEELAQCLRPLIATLPSTYGQALELTEIDGKTQGEAAEKLGLSLSGMKSRVQRGRTKLKEVLSTAATWRLTAGEGSSGTSPATALGAGAGARDRVDTPVAGFRGE